MAQGGLGDALRRSTPTAALLAWWRDAGHDCLVADEPRGWLRAPVADAPIPESADPQPAFRLQPVRRAPAGPQPAGSQSADLAEDFAAIDSLAALRDLAGRVPFGDGDPASGVMLLGEASSAEDLRSLRPFSGPAGELLDRMLAAIGLDRSRCYISNLCPRRPIPGAPTADDIARDLPLTRAHIRLVRPRALLLLGGTPAQALLGERTPIGRLRGSWLELDIGGAPVAALPTFNPAYLLRRPEDKRLAWADLRMFKARL